MLEILPNGGVMAARYDEEGRRIPEPGEALVPRKLEDVSVKEMEEYIQWLEEEIVRTRAEITKRGSVASAAEALFKK